MIDNTQSYKLHGIVSGLLDGQTCGWNKSLSFGKICDLQLPEARQFSGGSQLCRTYRNTLKTAALGTWNTHVWIKYFDVYPLSTATANIFSFAL